MNRVKPVGNKVIERKLQEAVHQLHKKQLQNIIPSVDSSSPLTYEIGFNFNKKKLQIMEDKYIEIERENRILLDKITTIMQKPQQLNQQNTQLSPILKSYHLKKSLNELQRKNQLIKITVENQNILKRLKNPKSNYGVIKLDQQWRQNERYKNNISEYFEVINYTEVNYPNKKDLNQSLNDPISAKSFHHQSIEKFYNKSDNQYQGRNSNNRMVSSNNRMNKDTKILAKKSKKIGLNMFIIQVSLDHGMFKITADDVEHPVTKILEMYESDGLIILKKFFQNSLDQLIDNLRISDNKLYIKGTENVQNNDEIQNNYIKKQQINKRQQNYSLDIQRKNQNLQEIIENKQENKDEIKINDQKEISEKNSPVKFLYDKKVIQEKKIPEKLISQFFSPVQILSDKKEIQEINSPEKVNKSGQKQIVYNDGSLKDTIEQNVEIYQEDELLQ